MFNVARDAFENSAALKGSPEVYRNLAIVCHALGQHNEAFTHYYNALVLLAQEVCVAT